MSGPLYSFPEPTPIEHPHEPVLDAPYNGPLLAYRCREQGCGWTGRGGLKAFDHHREDHHELELVNLPGRTVHFSCCETSDGRRVDAEGCRRCSAAIGEPCQPWCDEL